MAQFARGVVVGGTGRQCVQGGPQLHVVAGLLERALAQRGCRFGAGARLVDLREQELRAAAERAAESCLHEACEKVSSAGRVARLQIVVRQRERARSARLRVRGRREANRQLDKLGRRGGCASARGRAGSRLERDGDALVGLRRAEREMACPLLVALDKLGEPAVESEARAGGRRCVDGRGEQRVRELDTAAGRDTDDVGLLGGRESCDVDEPDRRGRQCRRHEQRVSARAR